MVHARTLSLCAEIGGIEPIADDDLDLRSDEAIISEIRSYRPVTSEKNIWAFWLTGFETLKPWTKRNVVSWARRNPGWDIRILDRIPGSDSHIDRYLDNSYFPTCFKENTMEGPYAPAHSADLIRLPCIHQHGGIWLDVSITLFRSLDEICWSQLTDPTTPYEVGGFVLPDVHKGHQHKYGYMENWFIAANKGNSWIARWHAIFSSYWNDDGRVESKDVESHGLFKHLEFGGYRSDMIDYLAQHVSFQRLRLLEDPEDGFSGPEYFSKKMYLLDCRSEGYHLPDVTSWQGQVAFDLMAAKYEPENSRAKKDEEIEAVMEKVRLSAARKKAAQERNKRRDRYSSISSSSISTPTSEPSTPQTPNSPNSPHSSTFSISSLSQTSVPDDYESTDVGPLCNGTITPDQNSTLARHITRTILANCSLSKNVHGFKGDLQLSDFWNRKENQNSDVEDGTCAELLRFASLHVRQTRALKPLVVEFKRRGSSGDENEDGEVVLVEPLLGAKQL